MVIRDLDRVCWLDVVRKRDVARDKTLAITLLIVTRNVLLSVTTSPSTFHRNSCETTCDLPFQNYLSVEQR